MQAYFKFHFINLRKSLMGMLGVIAASSILTLFMNDKVMPRLQTSIILHHFILILFMLYYSSMVYRESFGLSLSLGITRASYYRTLTTTMAILAACFGVYVFISTGIISNFNGNYTLSGLLRYFIYLPVVIINFIAIASLFNAVSVTIYKFGSKYSRIIATITIMLFWPIGKQGGHTIRILQLRERLTDWIWEFMIEYVYYSADLGLVLKYTSIKLAMICVLTYTGWHIFRRTEVRTI